MDVWSKRYWSCVGQKRARLVANPIIPTFNTAYDISDEGESGKDLPKSVSMTLVDFIPSSIGGHPRSLLIPSAIGKARTTQRIYELNQQLKQRLAKMP